MRIRSTVLAVTLVVAPLFGQTPPVRAPSRESPATAPIGTASLSGVALISTAGQTAPVRRARVIVREASGAVHTTDTDTLGQFRVGQLKAGTYKVIVDKPGFVPIGHDPVIDVRDGQAARTTIMMQRGAAIEGRLVTGDGEPAVGLTVSAVRLGYGPYGKKPVAVRQTTTDDLGRFRVHTLSAGEYYIEAAPDPLRVAAAPGNKPTRTYFAGVSRLNEAQVIVVAPEQQLSNIAFTVTSAALATVSGSVTTSAGKPPATFSIRVQRVGAPSGEVRCFLPSGRPDGERTFQCPNVPPGDFRLLVTSRAAPDTDVEFAAVPVSVEGRDLQNLRVATLSGVRVSGRVEVEGGAPLPPGAQIAALETEFEFPTPTPGGTTAATPPAGVDPDGAFTFTSLNGPRLFRANRLSAGWAVKEVWLDGVDITDTPTAIAASERPAVLRVVVTPRTGSVEGTVLKADRQPAAGTHVIIFADDVRRWTPRSRFIQTVEVGAAGRYAVSGLLPGQYRVAFVDLLDDGAWEDPDVLARLKPLATQIAIAGTERVTVDWRIR